MRPLKKYIAFFLAMFLFVLLISGACAEGSVYRLETQDGQFITSIHGECEPGDEYISGSNQHYRVKSVDKEDASAILEHVGSAAMPDVSWLDLEQTTPVSAMGQKKLALYCTHSDESYIEGDGTQSVEGKGGIYDIADALGNALEARGASIEISHETHLPHDAGAYRRSRQTAVTLLKGRPDGIFDIHRDGIPDPEEYAVSIGNEKMSKIRLLVGKSNQNKEANLSFAKQIKAVGDKIYPGLIKDIYMGKGTYNQDLAPRSVLLEFGTHTLEKERVLRSVKPISEVIFKAMYGGVTGSAGSSDVSPNRGTSSDEPETKPAAENNKGAGWAIWLVIGLIAALALFAFLSSGGRGGGTKFSRSISEMTGGLLGKKPPRED